MSSFSKEQRVILATEAIQNNRNLSRRQATRIYEVPKATLRSKMNGRTSRDDSRHGRQKLTESEKNAIIQYVLDLDERGFPPRIAGIEDMANLLLEKRDDGRVGGHWASRFIVRQEKLKTRLNRVYDFQRATYENPELIGVWFKLINNIRAKYNIEDNNLYNFDKTGFIIGVICSSLLIITRADR